MSQDECRKEIVYDSANVGMEHVNGATRLMSTNG